MHLPYVFYSSAKVQWKQGYIHTCKTKYVSCTLIKDKGEVNEMEEEELLSHNNSVLKKN